MPLEVNQVESGTAEGRIEVRLTEIDWTGQECVL